MKNLTLVSLILQLVITINVINAKYKFGDMIAFPRGSKRNPSYKHYAVFVGPNTEIDIGQGDNDIYHRSGRLGRSKPSDCRFDKLEKTRGKWKRDFKDNYLDGIRDFKPGTKEDIMKRINETVGKCDKYRLFTNNCEHLATYVRYGVKVAWQYGTHASIFFPKNVMYRRRRRRRSLLRMCQH
ncbi:phospholipase A and acyltransferase 1-like isoform X1 [Epinephelus fuscoguttatus]|uniref:phospholipase A and acyltransferase 1-like isoform X1 n=1 Tax=Epinephelus fuscoguttatus TaxID=293821 RepID=UPI0020D0FE36|nr:phospholipase A and acyltransferase 1-like isoform X1 [Epinephelus fuscoguttatus]